MKQRPRINGKLTILYSSHQPFPGKILMYFLPIVEVQPHQSVVISKSKEECSWKINIHHSIFAILIRISNNSHYIIETWKDSEMSTSCRNNLLRWEVQNKSGSRLSSRYELWVDCFPGNILVNGPAAGNVTDNCDAVFVNYLDREGVEVHNESRLHFFDAQF